MILVKGKGCSGERLCFLSAEHVAQLVVDRERVHQRQFGGAGIAEQDIDALLFEQLQEGALSGHCGHGFSPIVVASRYSQFREEETIAASAEQTAGAANEGVAHPVVPTRVVNSIRS